MYFVFLSSYAMLIYSPILAFIIKLPVSTIASWDLANNAITLPTAICQSFFNICMKSVRPWTCNFYLVRRRSLSQISCARSCICLLKFAETWTGYVLCGLKEILWRSHKALWREDEIKKSFLLTWCDFWFYLCRGFKVFQPNEVLRRYTVGARSFIAGTRWL